MIPTNWVRMVKCTTFTGHMEAMTEADLRAAGWVPASEAERYRVALEKVAGLPLGALWAAGEAGKVVREALGGHEAE